MKLIPRLKSLANTIFNDYYPEDNELLTMWLRKEFPKMEFDFETPVHAAREHKCIDMTPIFSRNHVPRYDFMEGYDKLPIEQQTKIAIEALERMLIKLNMAYKDDKLVVYLRRIRIGNNFNQLTSKYESYMQLTITATIK